MYSLAQTQDGIKSKRMSSYDTSGNNNDRLENIKPGREKIIFNVNGTGMIVV